MQTILLFDSVHSAQEVAFILRGLWDECNAVTFTNFNEYDLAFKTAVGMASAEYCQQDDNGLNSVTVQKMDIAARIAAREFLAKQGQSNYCYVGSVCRLPATTEMLLILYAKNFRDFQSVDLSLKDLSKAKLAGINFDSANLSHANLRNANLSHANLSHANLRNADLRNANLSHVNLYDAYLAGADFSGADLTRACLQQANLEGANFSGAKLKYATLRDSILTKANLKSANLKGAELQEANFEEADFRGANLKYAELMYSILTKANLKGANLYGACLQGAALGGIDQTRLKGAMFGDYGDMKMSTSQTRLKQKIEACIAFVVMFTLCVGFSITVVGFFAWFNSEHRPKSETFQSKSEMPSVNQQMI